MRVIGVFICVVIGCLFSFLNYNYIKSLKNEPTRPSHAAEISLIILVQI